MAKKPKVQIKREKTSLGWAYRIYIGGEMMGTALSRDAAKKSVPRMLKIYERVTNRALKAVIASSREAE
jgi:hypothetical protein